MLQEYLFIKISSDWNIYFFFYQSWLTLLFLCWDSLIVLYTVAPRKAKRQLSASFTSDGQHIISIGEDSNVYIWNYSKPGKLPSRSGKSIRSSEFFFSKGATIAVPWPGMVCPTMNDSSQISSQPCRALELVSRQKHPDCCSLNARLFPDSSSRVSATWPEEKLSWQTKAQLLPGACRQQSRFLHLDYWSLTPRAGTWSSVIVTAGIGGTIRSYHNYGLPTLWSKEWHSANGGNQKNIVIMIFFQIKLD